MPKPGKHIERAWLSYRADVLPAAAPSVQVMECRRAFYGGAWALLQLQCTGFTSARELTDADLAMMDSIDAELRQFYANVKAGAA